MSTLRSMLGAAALAALALTAVGCTGKNPGGSSIWSGKLPGGAAVAGHGARTKARTAMNSTTNLRTTNPRGRPNPLAELSIDYPRAHRQMAVPRIGLDGLPGLGHQIPVMLPPVWLSTFIGAAFALADTALVRCVLPGPRSASLGWPAGGRS